jgi:hypothetical protein
MVMLEFRYGLTLMINAAVCFVAIAGVALVDFGVFETPDTFLFEREVEEGLGLDHVSQ